jgi:hypothetical protein
MYLNLPDYQKLVIKDLYTVYLPPVPKRNMIQGWQLKKSDQVWQRAPIPNFYTERREEEKEIQDREKLLVEDGTLKKVTHFDPILEKYRRQEWMRRIYGHWLMINGEPVYLAPAHYMYLQWSKLDHPENDGYPLYYKHQVPRFYFRQLCEEDPFCLGYIIIGPRGPGKSSEEVACQLNNMTKPPHNRVAAIQSKSGDDAKDVVFKEKMVLMFNSYPDFFKPEYNHGSDPVEGMFFKRESKKGAGSKKVKFGPDYELGNVIKHHSAKEKALDGKTLSDVIQDEVGKTHPKKEADVNKRLSVVVKSVYRNQRKRGIIRCTSTVEEMKEGGNECYEIWKNSDPRYRDGNGYTVSKLYKYFINAAECRSDIADKFGDIDEEKGKVLVLNERIPLEHDLIEKSRVIRKNPLDEEEAFLRDQATSPFDVFILASRKQELSGLKNIGRKGKLEWLTEKDGDVQWVDDPAGHFTEFIKPDMFRGKRKMLNNARMEYDPEGKKIWYPVNDDWATGGLDPIRWTQTSDSRASLLASYGILRYDPLLDNGRDVAEWLSHNIMWKYHGRSKNPDDDYENIIKAMRYYGHRIMPEGNLSEFTKHAHMRGYWNYLIIRKDFDKTVLAGKSKNAMTKENPVNTQKEVIDAFVTRIIQFLNVHGRRLMDVPLIKQLQDFDPKNQTMFDLVIAFGYALIALEHRLNPNYMPTDQTPKDIETFFQTYDISGDRSKAIIHPSQYDDGKPDELITSINQMLKNSRVI